MYGGKPWKKWTAMYWLAHKAYSAVIQGWIRQCMKQPENWLLSGSEIHLVAVPYMFSPFPHTLPHLSPIASPVSWGISHVSPGVSSCFLFKVLRLSEYLQVHRMFVTSFTGFAAKWNLTKIRIVAINYTAIL